MNNLPELKGSEKQITWAVKIRKSFISSFQEEIEDEKEFGLSLFPTEEMLKEAISRFENIVQTETESHYWIDKRDWTNTMFIKYNPYEKEFN